MLGTENFAGTTVYGSISVPPHEMFFLNFYENRKTSQHAINQIKKREFTVEKNDLADFLRRRKGG